MKNLILNPSSKKVYSVLALAISISAPCFAEDNGTGYIGSGFEVGAGTAPKSSVSIQAGSMDRGSTSRGMIQLGLGEGNKGGGAAFRFDVNRFNLLTDCKEQSRNDRVVDSCLRVDTSFSTMMGTLVKNEKDNGRHYPALVDGRLHFYPSFIGKIQGVSYGLSVGPVLGGVRSNVLTKDNSFQSMIGAGVGGGTYLEARDFQVALASDFMTTLADSDLRGLAHLNLDVLGKISQTMSMGATIQSTLVTDVRDSKTVKPTSDTFAGIKVLSTWDLGVESRSIK